MSAYFSVYARKQNVDICLDCVTTTPTRWFRQEFGTLTYDKKTNIGKALVERWASDLNEYIAKAESYKNELLETLQEEKRMLCSATTEAAAENIRSRIDELLTQLEFTKGDDEAFGDLWCARRVLQLVETLRTVMNENEYTTEDNPVTFWYYAD